jgi:hypothetical protein
MSDLLIRITKRPDGGAVLRCQRADGSATWQRQDGRQGAFFPLHDLTHYAVESTLRFRDGFYGLLAAGWDIRETEGKSPRGALPAEALAVEHLVGMLDAERSSGTEWAATDVNREAARYAGRGGRPAPRALTDEELGRARARVRDLFQRWAALAPGESLELAFDRPPPAE